MSARSLDQSIQRLAGFCTANQLPWDQERAAAFRTYIELLLHFNRAMNLIGPLDADEIVDQLLIDSLTAAAVAPPLSVASSPKLSSPAKSSSQTPSQTPSSSKIPPRTPPDGLHMVPGTISSAEISTDLSSGERAESPAPGRMLDVGSGAGLPGVPLKIIFPMLPITLVEPRAKRTTFLKIVVERLRLEQVTIARCRLEELADERFDYVISKAFRAPTEWLSAASPWVTSTGQIVCMTRPDVADELDARARALQLRNTACCLDVSSLGAPSVGEKRAIFAFSPQI